MEEDFSNRHEYIVGLDIGSGSAKCMVGRVSDQCNLKVIDADEVEMTGDINNDNDLKENAECVSQLIRKIEKKTDLNIYTVYVTAGRGEIKGLNMTGALQLDGKRITRTHCEKVLESAERLSIPHGLEILHVLPQKYYIDESKKVVDPIGFTAGKLEVELHLITCDSKSLNRRRNLVKEAGYYVEGVVSDSLASFYGGRGLYSRERDVLIVNIGRFNTDTLLYVDSQIMAANQIFFGLNDIVNEFEYRFGITEKDAKKLLKSYTNFCNSRISVSSDEKNSFTIIQKKLSGNSDTFSNDYKKISENTISFVISYMMSKMIEKVKSSIIAYIKGDINDIQIVLMGGGAHLPESKDEFFEKFGGDIIIGENKLKSGGDLYGSAYGLLRYGIEDRKARAVSEKSGLLGTIIEKFKSLRAWSTVRLS